jgi:hypothetical protein
LRIRGIAFDAIGKQLGMTKQSAHALYKRVRARTPFFPQRRTRLPSDKRRVPPFKPNGEAFPSRRPRLCQLGGRSSRAVVELKNPRR